MVTAMTELQKQSKIEWENITCPTKLTSILPTSNLNHITCKPTRIPAKSFSQETT